MPTLAVDFRVLDFVTHLFVHIPLNNTGWCKTIEAFLNSQGYKLTTKDSLRQRFGNALQWYNALQDAVNKHVDMVLTHVRQISIGMEDGLLPDPTATPQSSTSIPVGQSPALSRSNWCRATIEEVDDDEFPFRSTGAFSATLMRSSETSRTPSPSKRQHPEVEVDDDGPFNMPSNPFPQLASPSKRPHSEVEVDDEDPFNMPSNPFPQPAPCSQPSDYLCSRCPICFGGEFPHVSPTGYVSFMIVHGYLVLICCFESPDAIVCLDASFTQKINKCERDPPHDHPKSVFIPESDTIRMEYHWEQVCGSQSDESRHARHA